MQKKKPLFLCLFSGSPFRSLSNLEETGEIFGWNGGIKTANSKFHSLHDIAGCHQNRSWKDAIFCDKNMCWSEIGWKSWSWKFSICTMCLLIWVVSGITFNTFILDKSLRFVATQKFPSEISWRKMMRFSTSLPGQQSNKCPSSCFYLTILSLETADPPNHRKLCSTKMFKKKHPRPSQENKCIAYPTNDSKTSHILVSLKGR